MELYQPASLASFGFLSMFHQFWLAFQHRYSALIPRCPSLLLKSSAIDACPDYNDMISALKGKMRNVEVLVDDKKDYIISEMCNDSTLRWHLSEITMLYMVKMYTMSHLSQKRSKKKRNFD